MIGVAIIAGLCMVVTDVAATIMVQAEAANRGWLAGWMDTFGYLFSIQTTAITVAAVNGHSLTKHIVVLACVSAANLGGTKLGQVTGKRLLARFPKPADPEMEALKATVREQGLRLAALEGAR